MGVTCGRGAGGGGGGVGERGTVKDRDTGLLLPGQVQYKTLCGDGSPVLLVKVHTLSSATDVVIAVVGRPRPVPQSVSHEGEQCFSNYLDRKLVLYT